MQITNSFQDIFRERLQRPASSRPPKLELTGILFPFGRFNARSFKLETADSEYYLKMSPELNETAKEMEWEEVLVKGYLDFSHSVFEVEKISLANPDPVRFADWEREVHAVSA